MTFEDLTEIVNGFYNAGTRLLDIRYADFGEEATDIANLFRSILKVSSVQIDQADLETREEIIISTGKSQGIPGLTATDTVSVVALFMLAPDGQPEVTLAYDLPNSNQNPAAWKFSTYFPKLAGTFFDSVELAPAPVPNFIYASFAYTDTTLYEGSAVGLYSGLNFHGGIIPVGSTFEILSVLMGELVDTPMTGPISNYDYGPTIELLMDSDASIATLFSEFDLPSRMRLYSAFTVDGKYYQAGLTLSVTFSLGPSSGLKASVTFTGADNRWVTVRGDFDNVSIPSPSELAEWIGGDGNDLNLLLPDDLKGDDAIFFNSLWFSFIPMTTDLGTVGFSLKAATGQGWELIPGWFTLKDIIGSFSVYNPFNSAKRKSLATLEGTIDVPSNDPALQVTAGTDLTGSRIWASLVEGTTFDLIDLIARFIPGLKDVPSLVFDQLNLYIELSSSPTYYQFLAHTDSTLVYNFGGTDMVGVERFSLDLSNGGPEDSVIGTMEAELILLGFTFDAVYNINQGFKIDGQLPDFSVDLSRFAEEVTGFSYDFPSWLPTLAFTESEAYISCQTGSTTSFDLALRTLLNISGLDAPMILTFETLETGGRWGYAVGIDIDLPKLSAFPGLSSLEPFDSTFRLESMSMIIATTDMPSYHFPDAGQFSNPNLNTKTIQLPASQPGLQAGLYLYALAHLDTTESLAMMQKFLQLEVDVQISLFIGEVPERDAKLMISIPSLEIQGGILISGTFGGILQSGLIALYMEGSLTAKVQGQPLEFDLTLLVVENGAFLSGTMAGTIRFESFQLSNLVLEIGISLEGIPSIGVAVTIDVGTMDSSLAIFFDSANPAQSMVAGAVSDTTAKQLYDAVLGQVVALPTGFDDILDQVALSGTRAFTISGDLASSLDNLQIADVSAAFAEQGEVIPDDQTSVLLVVSTRGELWYLTDMSTMRHYSLRLDGAVIQVSYEAQFYCVPMTTQLGAFSYPAGFFVAGAIDVFGIHAELKLLVDTQKGMAADAYLSTIIIWKKSFFSISAADGDEGPYFSLSTYTQPTLPEDLQPPHFLISGRLELLGLKVTSYVNITATSAEFRFEEDFEGVIDYRLNGSFTQLTDFSAGGDADVKLDATLDLGALGSCPLKTTATSSIDISYGGANPEAKANGRFTFDGVDFSIPYFALDVDSDALVDFYDTILDQVTEVVLAYLGDYQQWLKWIDQGLILGMEEAEKVGEILATEYNLAYDTIGNSTEEILHYGSSQVADALDGAGATADEAAQVMSDMGYAADEIESAITGAFEDTHCDVNTGHIDVPAVHDDMVTVPHTDNTVSHTDCITIPHGDSTITPHSDTKIHEDIPYVCNHKDHSDIPATHGDTPAVHSDIPKVHEDTASVHTDAVITPHSDVDSHVDLKT